jgi:hypothetical protein
MERKPKSKLDAAIDKILADNKSHHGGSRVLQHGDDLLIAPMNEILDCLQHLQGERDLPRLRRKVQRTIDQVAPKMKDGTPSQEEFRLFAQGMVILFAIDVLEGRETLNIN